MKIPVYQSQGVNLPNIDARGVADPVIRAGVGLSNAVMAAGKEAMNIGFAMEREEQRRQVDALTIKARKDFYDFRQGLDERDDYQAFNTDYEKFSEQWAKENVGNLSAEQKTLFDTKYASIHEGVRQDVVNRSRFVQIDQSRASLLAEGQTAEQSYAMAESEGDRVAVKGDYFGSIDGRVETGVLTASDGEKLKQAFSERADTAFAVNMLESNPAELAKRLGEEGFLPNLDPVQRSKFQKRADDESERLADKATQTLISEQALRAYQEGGRDGATKFLDDLANSDQIKDPAKRARAISLANTLVSAADAQEADKRAQRYSDMSIAASRGQLGYEDIEAAYKSNDLSPQQRTALTRTLDTATDNAQKAANATKMGAAFYDGQAVLDPREKDHRDAADGHFDSLLGKWSQEGLEPAQITENIIDYVHRTGYMPSRVKSQVRGGLRSPDNATVAATADMIDRLQDAAPHAVNDISDDDLSMGIMVAGLRDAGMTDKEAVEYSRETLSPKNKTMRDLADAEIKDGKFNDKYLGWMKDDFDGWFGSDFDFGNDRTAMAEARKDYESLFNAFYTRTGDKDAARKATKTRMDRKWGVTMAEGSGRLISYPPETIYIQSLPMVEDLNDRIKNDLEQTVRSAGHEGKYVIYSDDQTAREASDGRPTYQVWFQKDTGELVPSGRRWGLDVAEVKSEWESERSKAKASADKAVEDLKNNPTSMGLTEDEMTRMGDLTPEVEVNHEQEARDLRKRQQQNVGDVRDNAQKQRDLIDQYQGRR